MTSSSESEDMDHYDTPKALNELVRRLGDRTVLVLPTDNSDGQDGTSPDTYGIPLYKPETLGEIYVRSAISFATGAASLREVQIIP